MVASNNILQRITFETSRLTEFCSKKELVAQTGHAVHEWPRVVLKELVDNALDAAEEHGIAPEIDITVSTKTGEIVVTDNGPGLPSDTVTGIINFNVRISSREAYVSPTRGAQGNALMTIVAIPFVLDGNRGVTVIEAHGVASKIIFEMDPVRREPRPLIETSASEVQKGTRVTVRWPELACSNLDDEKDLFVQMSGDFATLNPHLSITVSWNGERVVDVSATDPRWRKWRACDPTSAHWYDLERFERYMAAHIARDEDRRHSGRTVREFIAELRGLTRSDKQKAVLTEVDASGVTLASFFGSGRETIGRLLNACREHTKEVKPEDLGLLGKDHLRAVCLAAGAAEAGFCYRKALGKTDAGLPYAIEVAFGYCPDEAYRQLVTGVNSSPGIENPFRQIGYNTFSGLLDRRYVRHGEPVIFILHYTCPRVDYTDRGKSAISLPWEVGIAIEDLVEKVTKAWHTQRKREEREASARRQRRDRLIAATKTTIKDAAWEVMEAAYLKASSGGTLPANARQIMYAARPSILALTDKDTLTDSYFTQTLLVDFVNEHPELCANWDIVYDARGHFREPHTKRSVPLGTLAVRRYLSERSWLEGPVTDFNFDHRYPTVGPENRYDTVLFVEKEGFDPLLSSADLERRFDVAVMSTKGMSNASSRELLDGLIERGVRRFIVLHDFDISGFTIIGTLTTDSRRYRFRNDISVIDMGLRLKDVEAMDLESEPVSVSGNWAKRAETLRRHGATEDEVAFLQDRRVELNAMTSQQFVDLIKTKFAENLVVKFVPDDDAVLKDQARRTIEQRLLAREIRKLSNEIGERVKTVVLPADLRAQVTMRLEHTPAWAWDDAVADIMRQHTP